MGQRLVALAHDDPHLQVVAAVDSPAHPLAGRDAGELAGVGPIGVPVAGDIPLTTRVDCAIDFSAPPGTMAMLTACVGRKIPLVVATTGHTAAQKDEIEAAAHETAILFAPNMSLVVNLLFKLVREAAEALKGKGFDAEIVERHHRFKKDSPSGTAVHFAEISRAAIGGGRFVHGREGLVGERTA